MKSLLITVFAVALSTTVAMLPGTTVYQRPAPLPKTRQLTLGFKPMATVEPIPITPQDWVKDEAIKYGWGDGYQWESLVTLVNNESGWRTNAHNPSGACGLFQALPCSKVAGNWQSPHDQAVFGMAYIQRTYGSPSNALSVWYSRSPHWY